MEISQLKEKSPLKIRFKNYQQELEIKGIVYNVVGDYLHFISDTKNHEVDRETFSSHQKYTIHKKNIIEISATKFQKEISEALKTLFQKIKKVEDTFIQIAILEKEKRLLTQDVKDFENNFTNIKFEHSDDIKDIAIKFNQDILQDLNTDMVKPNQDFPFVRKQWEISSSHNNRSIQIYNVGTEDKMITFSVHLSETKRNIVTVTSRNDYSDIDSHDWDEIAEQHAPRYDNLIQKEFDYVKNVKISRSASYGEKGYVTASSIYQIKANVKKENYEQFLEKFKQSIRNVISKCL